MNLIWIIPAEGSVVDDETRDENAVFR